MEKTVLIIDDDPIVRRIIQKIVSSVDPSVRHVMCDHGEAGLQSMRHALNSTDSLIILLDIHMPVLDGWGFLDRIDPRDSHRLRLYLLTSSSDANDMEKAEKYPVVQRMLVKPLSKNDVVEILNMP